MAFVVKCRNGMDVLSLSADYSSRRIHYLLDDSIVSPIGSYCRLVHENLPQRVRVIRAFNREKRKRNSVV